MVEYGLDVGILHDKRIFFEIDNGYEEISFNSLVKSVNYDVPFLRYLLKKGLCTDEQIELCIHHFFQSYASSQCWDWNQFYETLDSLYKANFIRGENLKNNIISTKLFEKWDEKLFQTLVSYGLLQKRGFEKELFKCATGMVQNRNKMGFSFTRILKLLPTLFSYTMQNDEEMNLLFFSDARESYELMQLGLDINHKSKTGDTPLLHAIKCCDVESVLTLLSLGADIHVSDKDGNSCEELVKKSDHGDLQHRFATHLKLRCLLEIMKKYQEADASTITIEHVEDDKYIEKPSPFGSDDCVLIQYSCIPGYSAQILSYFLSIPITEKNCEFCDKKFAANDSCRPNGYLGYNSDYIRNDSAVSFAHNDCFINERVMGGLGYSPHVRYIFNPLILSKDM